jgi:hypothetical protein
VPTSSTIYVRLRALDVDGLPINQTRAELAFTFGNHTLPMSWNRGSNAYAADVPSELTEEAGEYDIVVVAGNSWSQETASVLKSCEVLRLRVEVVADNKKMILAGGLAAALVLTLGILAFLLYRNRQRAKALLVHPHAPASWGMHTRAQKRNAVRAPVSARTQRAYRSRS